MNFIKALIFLTKFQLSVTSRFFFHKSTKTGRRFFQDFGMIEATFLTKTALLAMEVEYKAALEEMQKYEPSRGSLTAPAFDLGGKKSSLLS
jgi:hypothetical protein